MTSRSDELAEAVEKFMARPVWDELNGLEQALHRYRNSAPSEETHEEMVLFLQRRGEHIGAYPSPGWAFQGIEMETVARIRFWLPKPAPVPEITAEEVELG